MRQTCKVCKREDYWNYSVPDDLWHAIVPANLQSGVVCLGCFDRFAAERKIEYAGSVRNVRFAGDMAAFEFDIAKLSNGPYRF